MGLPGPLVPGRHFLSRKRTSAPDPFAPDPTRDPHHRASAPAARQASRVTCRPTSAFCPYEDTQYLVIYGTARITEGGAPELLQELARTYLGPT
jgi:hypothetical protein